MGKGKAQAITISQRDSSEIKTWGGGAWGSQPGVLTSQVKPRILQKEEVPRVPSKRGMPRVLVI